MLTVLFTVSVKWRKQWTYSMTLSYTKPKLCTISFLYPYLWYRKMNRKSLFLGRLLKNWILYFSVDPRERESAAARFTTRSSRRTCWTTTTSASTSTPTDWPRRQGSFNVEFSPKEFVLNFKFLKVDLKLDLN